jgi:hypothetical protein
MVTKHCSSTLPLMNKTLLLCTCHHSGEQNFVDQCRHCVEQEHIPPLHIFSHWRTKHCSSIQAKGSTKYLLSLMVKCKENIVFKGPRI